MWNIDAFPMARVLKRVASDLHRLYAFEQKLIINKTDNQMGLQLVITYQFNTNTGVVTTEHTIHNPKLMKEISKFAKNVWKRIIIDNAEYTIRKDSDTTGEIFLGFYKNFKHPAELKGVYVNRFRLVPENSPLIRSKSEGNF